MAPIKGMGAWAPAFRRSLELNQCSFASEAVAGLPTIVALPPPAASKFLAGRAPALEAELKKITMLPIVTVTAFFSPETSSVPGFGCLFPKREGYRALGVLANDRIFPNRSMDSLAETWLFGGALDSDILRLSDREILDLLIEERTKMHGVRPRLLHSKVTRWEGAIPHYDIHLENALENLATMEFREGNFRLFGNYLGELGLGTILSKAAELPKEFP